MTPRQRHLFLRYGLTQTEYDHMYAAQKGTCAICHQPERCKTKGIVNWLSVDHDHETGAVRALLCRSCNLMVGLIYENPSLLKDLASYLERYNVVV